MGAVPDWLQWLVAGLTILGAPVLIVQVWSLLPRLADAISLYSKRSSLKKAHRIAHSIRKYRSIYKDPRKLISHLFLHSVISIGIIIAWLGANILAIQSSYSKLADRLHEIDLFSPIEFQNIPLWAVVLVSFLITVPISAPISWLFILGRLFSEFEQREARARQRLLRQLRAAGLAEDEATAKALALVEAEAEFAPPSPPFKSAS